MNDTVDDHFRNMQEDKERIAQEIAQSAALEMVPPPDGFDLDTTLGTAASRLVEHLDNLAREEYGITEGKYKMRWNQAVLRAALYLNTQS